MKRSFSVPVNVKNPSLRRVGSTGGVVRVLPVTPYEVEAGRSFPNDVTVGESGMCIVVVLILCFFCFVTLL